MLYGLMIVTVGFYRLTNPDPHIARHPPFSQSHIVTVQKRFEFKLSVAVSHTQSKSTLMRPNQGDYDRFVWLV
jgi:hypothetical protein